MADSSDELFFDNVINTLSDDSDNGSEIMMDVTLLANEHEEKQMRMHKGSVLRQSAALESN
jgi:hypothetical protein